MTTFADIPFSEIKTDCRFYTGYKPCHKNDSCRDCPHYSVRSPQILIIKLGAMGDVLRTKAILPALKREHPTSWIVWLTDKGSEPLARDPLVDEVRAFTQEGLLALEGRHFARLLCLDKDAHAVALAAKISADRKQGFAPTPYNTITVWNQEAEYALRLGLSDELKFRLNRKTAPHIVAEAVALPYHGEEYGLVLSDAARAQAERVLSVWKRPAAGPIIGINTGCGPVFATKAWTPKNLSNFVGLLGRETDHSILLLGGKREEELHRFLLHAHGASLGDRLFDSGTDNSLETFFALIERSDAILSADSLGMHVAIALKRPVIAWFGPTCDQEVDLFGRGEKIVTDFPCSPCYLKVCPKPVSCMEDMAPRTVLDALQRVLAAVPR